MERYSNERTLQLKTPIGYLISLALLFLMFYFFTGEVLARIEVVRDVLTAPSMGSEHRGFERQLNRLDLYALERESIDCIFLGDSTVMTDFAPNIFGRAYREQTGKELDCFNFGVGASTVASSAALARILVNDYEPRLLIFGVQARDFAVPPESRDAAVLLETPWIRYRRGRFAPEGWLYEHSYLYRYLGTARRAFRFDTERPLLRSASEDQSGFHNGYYPLQDSGPVDIASPPDQESKLPYDEHYFGTLGDFQLLPINITALDEILELQSATTQVLIAEMPVPETFFYYYGNGKHDHQAFIDTVKQEASAKGVLFWETTPLQLFPSDVWFNYNHLNSEGAPIFSEWFGRQLGKAVQEETINFASG